MNLLYCGDKNIEQGLIISILSLIKNVKEEVNIYVLTVNLKYVDKTIEPVTDKVIEVLNNIVKEKNSKSNVKKIDITNMFEKEIPEVNMDTRFTPCCMLRLFADKIEEIPNKILYLDNDIVIRKDITEFYHQNIDQTEFAGVLDFYGRFEKSNSATSI